MDQNQVQLKFHLKSNQMLKMPLVDIKNQVQNKLCPKIAQPLLTIHKYSVVHVGIVVVIY